MRPDVLAWQRWDVGPLKQPRRFELPPASGRHGRVGASVRSPGRVLFPLSRAVPWLTFAALLILILSPRFGFYDSWGRGEPDLFWLMLAWVVTWMVSGVVLELLMRLVTRGNPAAAVRPYRYPVGLWPIVAGGLFGAAVFSTIAIILTVTRV